MVVGQPRLRMIAFQVFDGVLVTAATASSGTGVPKVYRVTRGLKAENYYLVDKYGGQGRNRTADTGIFRFLYTNQYNKTQQEVALKSKCYRHTCLSSVVNCRVILCSSAP